MRSRTRVFFLASLLLIGVGAALLALLGRPTEFDRYLAATDHLQIQATAKKETRLSFHAPGAIIEYEWRANPDSSWRTITTFRYSHRDPLPRNQVHFLNGSVAYFFHEFIFAVTTDGGVTWCVRGEPDKSLDTMHQWAFPRIESVEMSPNGTGRMKVSPYSWQQLTSDILVTTDFGKTWATP